MTGGSGNNIAHSYKVFHPCCKSKKVIYYKCVSAKWQLLARQHILHESLAKCVEKAKATTDDSTTKIKSKGNEHVWAAYLHVTIRTIQIQKNSNLMLSELVLSLDL